MGNVQIGFMLSTSFINVDISTLLKWSTFSPFSLTVSTLGWVWWLSFSGNIWMLWPSQMFYKCRSRLNTPQYSPARVVLTASAESVQRALGPSREGELFQNASEAWRSPFPIFHQRENYPGSFQACIFLATEELAVTVCFWNALDYCPIYPSTAGSGREAKSESFKILLIPL